MVSVAWCLPPELKPNIAELPLNGGEQRTQWTNSRANPMLTISAPWRSSVKILSVASPEALFSTLTSSLFGACVASACRVTAALLLRQCWTLGDFLRGARSSSVFMIHSAYVWNFTVCVCVLSGQRERDACQDVQMKQMVLLTSEVDWLKPLVS